METIQPDTSFYREAIRAAFPDLRVETCAWLAEGWDSVACEVNGALVFRFPKRPEVAAILERELCLTRQLLPELPAPLPDVLYVAPRGGLADLPFAGYPKLGGVGLDALPHALHEASPLAPQLAAFLSGLHQFPLARVVECGFSAAAWSDWVDHWLAFRARFKADEAALLDPTERAAAGRLWDDFIAELTRTERRVALIHGDLALEHILVSPAGDALTGVIDWGDATIGDPALDFAAFVAHAGRGFVAAMLTRYEPPPDDGLLRRADWYGRIGPFHELRFGVETGQPEHVERGLAGIRRLAGGNAECGVRNAE